MSAHIIIHTPESGAVPLEGCPVSVVTQVRDDSDDLLTQREAAALAKVDPRTIRRWIAQGYLTPVRLGPRSQRIRKTDLLKPRKTHASR